MRVFIFCMTMMMALPVRAETIINPECAIPKQADIGADYVPGIDVNGVQVAPANVGGATSAALPSPMVVPVTVDLAERVGISSEAVEMTGTVGFLEIYPDGKVLYNGDDLTQKVSDLCGRRDILPPVSPDGQPPVDAIE